MKAEDVYNRVKQYFCNHEHKMLNKYIFRKDWESDYFCVSKSGYCVEVEVKVSKSDFRADFEKPKHKIIQAILLKQTHYIERLGMSEYHNLEMTFDVETKQQVNLGYPKADCNLIRIHDLMNRPFPNKFWYAMPDGMITEKEVPAYAGLIFVSEDGYSIVKDAPFIHKRKLDLPNLLFDKYRWGYQNQAQEIEMLKHKLWQAEEKVKNLTLQVNQVTP